MARLDQTLGNLLSRSPPEIFLEDIIYLIFFNSIIAGDYEAAKCWASRRLSQVS